MLIPTMIPVTAGKKTAKVSQKFAARNPPQNTGVSVNPVFPIMGKEAKTIEKRENPTIPKIMNWVLDANCALT